MLTVIGVYIALGILSTIVIVAKEPILVYAWFLLPFVVLGFPYFLWVLVLFPDNTGRWI